MSEDSPSADGNTSAWYGELDMVIIPREGLACNTSTKVDGVANNVAVSTEVDEGKQVTVTDDSLEEGASYDNSSKESSPEDESSVEGSAGSEKDDSVVGKCKSLNQSYTITVTFSHVYHSRHPERTFFPSIQISPHWLKVFIYDMKSFVWTAGSFLVLWAVLNYFLFLKLHVPQSSMPFIGSREPWNDFQGFEVADRLHYMEERRNVTFCSSNVALSYGPLVPIFDDVLD